MSMSTCPRTIAGPTLHCTDCLSVINYGAICRTRNKNNVCIVMANFYLLFPVLCCGLSIKTQKWSLMNTDDFVLKPIHYSLHQMGGAVNLDLRHLLHRWLSVERKWHYDQIFVIDSTGSCHFRITGPLCGEFTGHRWIPRTKASDA